ncbi:alpha-L-fucosidase [Paenibacillus sp. GD4]|uniref:alpha-L-fucosidase n=1 Tax=Paenibacillus sp. GD4 TaxID=3068890 RepID=UPI0027968631|nr:alpha-L-fucosidase [Paenibacillus sp. GD4]MDQ1913957.1 alpha-L-fucosidase [Paenibacillus sp. GD4]
MTEQEDLMDNAGSERPGSQATDADASHDARMAWWREARVGLFIHWGLYSLPGGIWKGEEVKASYAEHLMLRAQIPIHEYERIADDFQAKQFDAKQWVRLAKMAGLRYLIFTAKHHEGFAMYDSSVSDYNIVKRTPFGRDPLKELADACREEDVKLCIYYSHSMDWHHPDSQGNTWDYPGNIGAYDEVSAWIGDEDKRSRYERYLRTFAQPQVRELLENYGQIGLVWFDCGHKLTEEQGAAFVEEVRKAQPDCLVNRRVYMEPYGDYGNTSDNQPHVRVPRQDWESIATLNDSWGYKAADNNWKTSEAVLRQMLDVLSLNGNFVINVGPTGDGAFDPKSVELLKTIGDWMHTNGEAVYGTTRSPIGKPPWGRCTRKGRTLYLHVFDWPKNGRLLVPGIRSTVKQAYALADPERLPLAIERAGTDDIVLAVPSQPFAAVIPVIALELASDCETNPLPLLYEEEYPNILGAFDADIGGSTLRYDTGKKGRDNLVAWNSLDDEARWRVRANGPGRYRVTAVIAADSCGGAGSFELSVALAGAGFVGDGSVQRLVGHAAATGGLQEFAPVELGSVDIGQAGEYELKLRAVSIPGETLMSFKQLILERL